MNWLRTVLFVTTVSLVSGCCNVPLGDQAESMRSTLKEYRSITEASEPARAERAQQLYEIMDGWLDTLMREQR